MVSKWPSSDGFLARWTRGALLARDSIRPRSGTSNAVQRVGVGLFVKLELF